MYHSHPRPFGAPPCPLPGGLCSSTPWLGEACPSAIAPGHTSPRFYFFRRCSYKEQPYKYDCPTLQIHCQFFQPISSLTLVGTNCVCEHGIMLINNVSHKVIDLFTLNPIPIIAWILKIINILPIGYIQIVIFL